MSTRQLNTLLNWINTVDRIGLLVLGQPLWLLSESYDNALCDYPEFDKILDCLAKNMRSECHLHYSYRRYTLGPINGPPKPHPPGIKTH